MNITIINEPDNAKDYEFIVVTPLTDETYLFVGMFEDGLKADECATKCKGIIFHDVRIQGKRKPEPQKKYFKIRYVIEDALEAESEEEALEKFSDNQIMGYYDADPEVEELSKKTYDEWCACCC